MGGSVPPKQSLLLGLLPLLLLQLVSCVDLCRLLGGKVDLHAASSSILCGERKTSYEKSEAGCCTSSLVYDCVACVEAPGDDGEAGGWHRCGAMRHACPSFAVVAAGRLANLQTLSFRSFRSIDL